LSVESNKNFLKRNFISCNGPQIRNPLPAQLPLIRSFPGCIAPKPGSVAYTTHAGTSPPVMLLLITCHVRHN
ncbi:MAG: hypothetical protein ABF535_07685, partial [Acetobacter sp.]